MANDVAVPPLPAFRFEVAITVENGSQHGLSNPLCSAAFAECNGIEASMAPKTLQEGGNNREQVYLVGPVTYAQLTLKRGMTDNLDLWRWFNAVSGLQSASGARAQVEVKVMKADGSVAVTYTLSRCLPVKIKAPGLVAKDAGLAIEELVLAYAKFEIRAA